MRANANATDVTATAGPASGGDRGAGSLGGLR
jgi:hypothetical protein